MKNKFLAMAAMAVIMASCGEKKGSEPVTDEQAATEQTDGTTIGDSALITPPPAAEAPLQSKEGDIVTVTGEVTEITKGKDGYMAKIKNAEGTFYTVTISIPNLKDPKQYRAVNAGDKITATGEVFILGEDTGVKATALE